MDDKFSNITNYVPVLCWTPIAISGDRSFPFIWGPRAKSSSWQWPNPSDVPQLRWQYWAKSLGDNDALNNLFFPFSFIIPLKDKQDLYIGTPATTISIPKGFCIIFRGGVPHGGMTYRATEWHPCVHGHMDSDHHTRASSLFNYYSEHDGYLRVEHMLLMHNTDNMCAHFLDIVVEGQYNFFWS